MDAARAAMGQGWPFAACPWNDDGAREPDEVGPDGRGKTFCLLLGRLPKVSRCKSGTDIGNNVEAAGSRRREVSRLPPQWWMEKASSTLRLPKRWSYRAAMVVDRKTLQHTEASS